MNYKDITKSRGLPTVEWYVKPDLGSTFYSTDGSVVTLKGFTKRGWYKLENDLGERITGHPKHFKLRSKPSLQELREMRKAG